jgi:hypothetical protein
VGALVGSLVGSLVGTYFGHREDLVERLDAGQGGEVHGVLTVLGCAGRPPVRKTQGASFRLPNAFTLSQVVKSRSGETWFVNKT